MGILLWMWLVLAFPVALLIDMLMTPKGNRDEAHDHDHHHDRDDRRDADDREIQRQREQQRGAAAMARDNGRTMSGSDEATQRRRLAERNSAAMQRGYTPLAQDGGAMTRDGGRLTSNVDEEDINRQREQDRIRMADRGGRHVPAQ